MESCTSLYLSLDLSMISLPNITLHIKHSGVVSIGKIIHGKHHQTLHVAIEDVEVVTIKNQILQESSRVSKY